MQSSHPNLNYYRPSGAAPIAGVLLTLIAGLVAAVPLALLYSFINYHDPLIYLNILLLLGFGMALGWVMTKGVRKFHIRNVPVVLLTSLLVFAAAYLVHWPFYVSTVLVDWKLVDWNSDSPYDIAEVVEYAWHLIQNPKKTMEIIIALNENGIWSIGGRGNSSGVEVNGILLTITWLLEAGALLFCTVTNPLGETRKPYSDRSEKWLEEAEMPAAIEFVEDKEKLLSAISRNDFSLLTTPARNIESDEKGISRYATVVLYDDPVNPFITVNNITIKKKKKKEDVSKTEIVRYLQITPSAAKDIASALAEIPAPDAPSEPDDTNGTSAPEEGSESADY